jgi:hypothetical protein
VRALLPWVAMPRSALFVVASIALALVGGCRPAADAEPVGSPGGPGAGVAGTEAEGSRPKPGSGRPGTDKDGPARSLVAVAITKSGEAGPCERVCGSLGDCLLADEDYSSAVAGRLELQCLDLCVHAPDDNAGKRGLLGCGGQACPELAACAERSWAAMSAGSSRVEPGAVVSNNDPCMEGCQLLWSCMASGQPPGRAGDPDLEREMEKMCTQTCESLEREVMIQLRPCVVDHCSDQNAIFACWSSVVTY